MTEGKPGTETDNGIGGYPSAADFVETQIERQARAVMQALGMRENARFRIGADGDGFTLRLHPVSFVIASRGYHMFVTVELSDLLNPNNGWAVRVGYTPGGIPTIEAQGIVPGPVIEACQRAYENLPGVDWDTLP